MRPCRRTATSSSRGRPTPGARPRPPCSPSGTAGEPYALVMLLPPAATRAAGSRAAARGDLRHRHLGLDGGRVDRAGAPGARRWRSTALAPGDRFNVIEFNSRTGALFAAPRAGGPAEVDARPRAGSRGSRPTAAPRCCPRSGRRSRAPPRPAACARWSSSPTALVGNEDELFALHLAEPRRRRLFTVGIGSAPNGHFMTKAAQFGRGTYTYIGEPERGRREDGRALPQARAARSWATSP